MTIINHQKILKLCLDGKYSLDEADIEDKLEKEAVDAENPEEESDESTFADYGDDFEDKWD